MARCALRLRPFDGRRRRAADCQAGRGAVDRKPEAPETTPKSTVHIEKSEVKAGCGRHGDTFEHDPSFPERLPRLLPKALAFWSMTVEKSQIFWTMSCRRQKTERAACFTRNNRVPEAINQGTDTSRASFPVWRAVEYKMPGKTSGPPVRAQIAAYSLLSLYPGMFQGLGDIRHPAALETRDFEVIGAGRRCLIVGDGTRAVRRPGFVQGSIRVACRHNDKAEMRQRIIH